MIPVEKIASGSLGNLLYYVAIVGLLIVVATIIRLKVSFLRKAFIPASLLAGLIGLILGPNVTGVIPADMMSSIGALPSHMITVVFACMLLGMSSEKVEKEEMHDVVSGVLWLWSNTFAQVGIPALLCVAVLVPMFHVNDLFACIFEIGFAGGHGTAGGFTAVFTETYNWAEGADLAKTVATIGLLLGIFVGMAIINFAVRKKWTKVLTAPVEGNTAMEVFVDDAREASSHSTISNDVVEPFAFHMGIIGIAILLGRLFVWGFGKVFGYTGLPLFPFAMIGGFVINLIVRKTSLWALFDRQTFCRIQGMALEVLITAAVMSISIPVIVAYWAPLLLGALVCLATVLFWTLWVGPRVFKDCWFEQSIMRYGAYTGVAAIGYMLLRCSDPKYETKAASNYALGTTVVSPFIGGGLVTSMWPILITSMGLTKFALLACGISIALLAVLLVFFRVKGFKYKQR